MRCRPQLCEGVLADSVLTGRKDLWMKLFYSLKRKVLAVCLAGMILMALCVGGISLWTISHLTYDYEIQNMNHLVDTTATIIDDELLRSENIVNYTANAISRKVDDPAQLRDLSFRQRLARSSTTTSRMPVRISTSSARTISTIHPRISRRSGRLPMAATRYSTMSWPSSRRTLATRLRAMCSPLPI